MPKRRPPAPKPSVEGSNHLPRLQIASLVIVLLVAAVIRFVQLTKVPSVLNRDEAALAYNAYLLMKSGKDEWNRSWPVSLESFGDYKLPGYPLLLIGSFRVFGVNDFAVRFPSALAGVLLVGVAYLFCRSVLSFKHWTAAAVSLAFALQPAFIFYSRMAWEANVGLLFFVTGLTLLLGKFSTQKNRVVTDTLALMCFLLAIFTYNTPLLLLPFVGLAIIISRGWRNWRTYLLPVIGSAVIFGVGMGLFASLSQQKSAITIFSDETYWQESVNYHESFHGLAQKLIGNRYVFFGRAIVIHLLQSWSPQFLVQKGGQHPWHNLPGHGHFYLAFYLLALIGVGQLVRKSVTQCKDIDRKQYWATLFLLLTSLIPAVITVDAPHATRSLFFFFLLTVLVGLGLDLMLQVVANKSKQTQNLQVVVIILLAIGLLVESNQYLYAYFFRYKEQSRLILKGGLEQSVTNVERLLDSKNDQVAIVDPDGFLYIQVAWYLKMSPEQFQQTITRHLPDRIGFRYGYRLGRYRFIAHREDRQKEDKYIIEWNTTVNKWLISQ